MEEYTNYHQILGGDAEAYNEEVCLCVKERQRVGGA